MSYSNVLKSYIKSSRLTLDEISALLSAKKISASPQYISKLQNGKVPPASEELNRALAEILGVNPEAILFYSFLEKAPYEVKKLFLHDSIIKKADSVHENKDVSYNLTPDEIRILEEIKKYPLFFHDLARFPEKNVKSLVKVWDVIKEFS